MRSPRYIIVVLAVFFMMSAVSAYADWNTDGNWVCNRANDQERVEVIPDGSGGVIMVWEDPRVNASYPDIYAQRFNRFGQPVWEGNGVGICVYNNIQQYPRIAPDGSGGAYIAWADNRLASGRDIYAQHVDADGNVQWGPSGIAVCVQTGWQNEAHVVTDGAGGAIISWRDSRIPANGGDIYAQRLNAAGTAQWTANGVVVCATVGNQVEHDMTADGAGGAILAWEDQRVFSDVYAQRINSSGNPVWTANGVVVSEPGYMAKVKVVSDGKLGAIIAWEDNRAYRDIYTQRIRADGTPAWTVDGVPFCSSADAYQIEMNLVADGDGGAIVALIDDRDVDYDIRGQKVDSLGTMLWGADGVAVCNATGTQYWPHLVGDGSGGAIFTWEDDRFTSTDIYAQRISDAGIADWAANGVSISSATGTQRQGRPATDGEAGAYVAWPDERGTSKDIYVNHVSGDGYVPVLLAATSTSITDKAITLRWMLSAAGDGLVHSVFRAEGSGEFEELAVTPASRGLEFEVVDAAVAPGVSYRYRVYANDVDGLTLLFTTDWLAAAPAALTLEQNNPNPFNPATTVSFTIPAAGYVTLRVFDVSGSRVATLVDGPLVAGDQEFLWEGTDDAGNRVSSGLYFYRLSFGKRTLTRKMLMLK